VMTSGDRRVDARARTGSPRFHSFSTVAALAMPTHVLYSRNDPPRRHLLARTCASYLVETDITTGLGRVIFPIASASCEALAAQHRWTFSLIVWWGTWHDLMYMYTPRPTNRLYRLISRQL